MPPNTVPGQKRGGPTVLVRLPSFTHLAMLPYFSHVLTAFQVTDAREQRPQTAQRPQQLRRATSRLITVDNVLQYASDIPSAQQRYPQRPRHSRTPSGRPLDPRLTGRLTPGVLPARSTKVSEKLVLLPETAPAEDGDEEKKDFDEDNEEAPLRDDEEGRRKPGMKGKSYAERLPKSRRTEKLARVTAYCTAQAYKMHSTAQFVREKHGARTKMYDDCLYTVYHLPLLPGSEGYRLRSSPVLKSPGGKAVLDEEIERSERRDYHEGYFDDTDKHYVRDAGHESPQSVERAPENDRSSRSSDEWPNRPNLEHRRGSDPGPNISSEPLTPVAPSPFAFAEMFVFSYGVVVFWNFTERQEKDVLADLTFSEHSTGLSLVTRPQLEEDFETEEFHFEYSADIPRPRVYNDMITLRSRDHMIKLAMSHAIAQSTKLSAFEEDMSKQMAEAQHVPRRLALTGKLGMERREVVRILGSLFKSRVEVNLCKFRPYSSLSHPSSPYGILRHLSVSTFPIQSHL